MTEDRIFTRYKNRLMNEGTQGQTRYNVVQYLCRGAGIDPVEMAAALIREGCYIAFDDSSISQAENNANKKAVERLLRK